MAENAGQAVVPNGTGFDRITRRTASVALAPKEPAPEPPFSPASHGISGGLSVPCSWGLQVQLREYGGSILVTDSPATGRTAFAV